MIPKKLTEEIERWIKEKKFGNIQLNFQGGRIVNFTRTESLKVECTVVGFTHATAEFRNLNNS